MYFLHACAAAANQIHVTGGAEKMFNFAFQ